MDRFTPEKRSEIMRAVRSRDTGPELRVAEILDTMGVRYERNVRGLEGTPDFLLTDIGTIVFVDGDFWHGRDDERVQKLSSRWRAKIEANVRRDVRQRRHLRSLGWSVHRIWEGDLKVRGKAERRLDKVFSKALMKMLKGNETMAEPADVIRGRK